MFSNFFAIKRRPLLVRSPEQIAMDNKARDLKHAWVYADRLVEDVRYHFRMAMDRYRGEPMESTHLHHRSHLFSLGFTLTECEALLEKFYAVETEFPGWKLFLSREKNGLNGFKFYVGSPDVIAASFDDSNRLRAQDFLDDSSWLANVL